MENDKSQQEEGKELEGKHGGKKDIIKAWWQPAFIIFAKMSAWIVFPVVAGAFLGQYLDRRWDSEPWAFLVIVGFAFLVSVFGLVATAQKEIKKMDRDKEKD